MDVSVEGDTTNESLDGYVECEVGGTPKNIAGAGSSGQQQCSNSHEDEVGGVGSGDEFSDVERYSNEFFTATGSDEEDNDKESYGSFQTFLMPKSMDQYKWEVGTYFTEKKEFTEAIRTYALANRKNLRFDRNDKNRVTVKCVGAKGKCNWYAYCAYMSALKS